MKKLLFAIAFLATLSAYAQNSTQSLPTIEESPEVDIFEDAEATETSPNAANEKATETFETPGPEETTPVLTTEPTKPKTPSDIEAEAALNAKTDASETTPVLTMEEDAPKDDEFNPRRSHWVTSFGFDTIKYELPWLFDGARKNFLKKKQEYFGARLGIGREIHLGGGIMTTTKLEGYYMGSMFRNVKTADPDIEDAEFSEGKRIGQLMGADISQSLSCQFNYSTKNPILGDMVRLIFEPFVEAGIGYAQAFNKINYGFNTGSSGVDEAYRHKIQDTLNTRRIGAGFNILSRQGYFFFMKATQYQLENTKRKQSGFEKPDQQAVQALDFQDQKPGVQNVTSFSLGGGYKF